MANDKDKQDAVKPGSPDDVSQQSDPKKSAFQQGTGDDSVKQPDSADNQQTSQTSKSTK